MTDLILARRVGAGDTDAFGELYRDYSDRVYSLCVLLLHDREEAADDESRHSDDDQILEDDAGRLNSAKKLRETTRTAL